MRALIAKNGPRLLPEWLNAEYFVTNGNAKALAVTARLLPEKVTDWREQNF